MTAVFILGAYDHLEALQVQQKDAWQAAQHMVDPVPHCIGPAAFACLDHLLVLRSTSEFEGLSRSSRHGTGFGSMCHFATFASECSFALSQRPGIAGESAASTRQ